MNLACGLLETSSVWDPVRTGESGDFVYRRHDDLAYAKVASRARVFELAGERDRLAWLHGGGVACPEIIEWRESAEEASRTMTAIP